MSYDLYFGFKIFFFLNSSACRYVCMYIVCCGLRFMELWSISYYFCYGRFNAMFYTFFFFNFFFS